MPASDTSPATGVLFKATGVNTMHRELADRLPVVIQRGVRLSDRKGETRADGARERDELQAALQTRAQAAEPEPGRRDREHTA